MDIIGLPSIIDKMYVSNCPSACYGITVWAPGVDLNQTLPFLYYNQQALRLSSPSMHFSFLESCPIVFMCSSLWECNELIKNLKENMTFQHGAPIYVAAIVFAVKV